MPSRSAVELSSFVYDPFKFIVLGFFLEFSGGQSRHLP